MPRLCQPPVQGLSWTVPPGVLNAPAQCLPWRVLQSWTPDLAKHWQMGSRPLSAHCRGYGVAG